MFHTCFCANPSRDLVLEIFQNFDQKSINPKVRPYEKTSTRPDPIRILRANLTRLNPFFDPEGRVQRKKSGRVWPHYSWHVPSPYQDDIACVRPLTPNNFTHPHPPLRYIFKFRISTSNPATKDSQQSSTSYTSIFKLPTNLVQRSSTVSLTRPLI